MCFNKCLAIFIFAMFYCCDGWILHAKTLCNEMNDHTEKGNNITIKYTIRNHLAEPWFLYERNVTSLAGNPFIRFMERAADEDENYQFSSTYYSRRGYFIETIGKDRLAGTPGLAYWRFVLAPSTGLSVGVSSYIPKDGDHIILDYVIE